MTGRSVYVGYIINCKQCVREKERAEDQILHRKSIRRGKQANAASAPKLAENRRSVSTRKLENRIKIHIFVQRVLHLVNHRTTNS